jgi:hypothetical protein
MEVCIANADAGDYPHFKKKLKLYWNLFWKEKYSKMHQPTPIPFAKRTNAEVNNLFGGSLI